MLSWDQYKKIKKELDDCKRPLIFFDDDPDGLCAFLLFYRYKREGKGLPLKTAPKLSVEFMKYVREYGPDKIFVLDIPLVDQDFLDEANEEGVPVVWLDHHTPEKREYVTYFNPRKVKKDDNTCTTANAYYTLISEDPKKSENKKDLWLAAIGAVGDWQLPDYMGEFSEKYPKLLNKRIVKSKKPERALFGSPLGSIVKSISFMLKGKTSKVMKCIKILTRIEEPEEILEGTTPRGKFLLKNIEKTELNYHGLLKKAEAAKSKDKILLFRYSSSEMSYTKELSNELLFKYPKKIIIIGREKSGELKMSLRSSKIELPAIVKKSLQGVEGYGGGHEHACGTCVKLPDADKFLKQFKKELTKLKKKK